MANGVETFLSKIGKDIKGVFDWLGSAQGKAAVGGGEAILNIALGLANPALAAGAIGIESLVNSGLQSAVTAESLAAAAGAQSGTGPQKAVAVTNSLIAQSAAFLKSVGVSDATAQEVQSIAAIIGTSSANILNAIPARATGAPVA